MDISKVIIYIILIFMVVGIVDKIVFKNRYGYGVQFDGYAGYVHGGDYVLRSCVGKDPHASCGSVLRSVWR